MAIQPTEGRPRSYTLEDVSETDKGSKTPPSLTRTLSTTNVGSPFSSSMESLFNKNIPAFQPPSKEVPARKNSGFKALIAKPFQSKEKKSLDAIYSSFKNYAELGKQLKKVKPTSLNPGELEAFYQKMIPHFKTYPELFYLACDASDIEVFSKLFVESRVCKTSAHTFLVSFFKKIIDIEEKYPGISFANELVTAHLAFTYNPEFFKDKESVEYAKGNSLPIGPNVVKELVEQLVRENTLTDYLDFYGNIELKKDPSVYFRGNGIIAKIIQYHGTAVFSPVLSELKVWLDDKLNTINPLEYEIDPFKINSETAGDTLKANQERFKVFAGGFFTELWSKNIPDEFMDLIRERKNLLLQSKFTEEQALPYLGELFFLRVTCPYFTTGEGSKLANPECKSMLINLCKILQSVGTVPEFDENHNLNFINLILKEQREIFALAVRLER